MFDDKTAKEIEEEIVSGISADVDTREGSYARNLIAPLALEIWKTREGMRAYESIAYVNDTSGPYIDKRAAEYGITRKPGQKAHTVLTVIGTNGVEIPKGKVFLTAGNDALEYISTETAVISSGKASVPVVAAEIGEKYNAAVGEICRQFQNLYGIKDVSNGEVATGGVDEESDEALVARYYQYLQEPPTSGNVYDYESKALEVTGVGAVKVFPLWNGNGTVKVLIVDEKYHPVDAEIVAACQKHLESKMPIGAQIMVRSAENLVINVAAVVTIDRTTTAEKVQEDFKAAIAEYLADIAFDQYKIVYNRIAGMLMDIDGVTDYSSLTLNGGTANVAIGGEQVPEFGTVAVTTIAEVVS